MGSYFSFRRRTQEAPDPSAGGAAPDGEVKAALNLSPALAPRDGGPEHSSPLIKSTRDVRAGAADVSAIDPADVELRRTPGSAVITQHPGSAHNSTHASQRVRLS